MAQGRAPIPLTEEEITDRFGSYIDDCIEALETDLAYVERMAAAGTLLVRRRQRAAEAKRRRR